MTTLIDGKVVSAAVKHRVKQEAEQLKQFGVPTLAVIIVGDDVASHVYVKNKAKACEFCGFRSLEYALSAKTSQSELLELIERLNADESVNGILCQLPLPAHLDEQSVIEAISPEKDVDCFNPINVGKLWTGDYSFKPCTPAGIIELLDYYNIPIEGKKVTVIGRSNIVGKPMAALMLERNATVTFVHSYTKELIVYARLADIVVCSVGKPGFLTENLIGNGAVVIDVGINRNEWGQLCGDVKFDEVAPMCSAITPVPGGVGPMTIAMLMENTLTAFKNQNGINDNV